MSALTTSVVTRLQFISSTQRITGVESDHFKWQTKTTKLRVAPVALVVSSVSSESSSSCWMCPVVLFDKLDTAKMHGLDMSNVSIRVVSRRDEPSGIWAIRWHNSATLSFSSKSTAERISPALQQLHWLPVKHRVTFKIATLMHKILQKRCPSYLADLVTFNTTYSQRRQLRFSTTRSAAVRRARTQFGKRAFSVCGPIVWNSLPIALRNIDSYPAFRRALKSHLFSCAFCS